MADSDSALEVLTECRTYLARQGHARKAEDAGASSEVRLRSRRAMYNYAVDVLSNRSGVVHGDLDSTAKTAFVAADLLVLLLKGLPQERTPGSSCTPRSFIVEPADEIALAKLTWDLWESPIGITKLLRELLTKLLVRSNVLHPDSSANERPATRTILQLVSGSTLFTKRTLNVLAIAIPACQPSDVLEALSQYASSVETLLEIFLRPLEQDSIASAAGHVANAWVALCQPLTEVAATSEAPPMWLPASLECLLRGTDRARTNLCQYFILPLCRTRPSRFSTIFDALGQCQNDTSQEIVLSASMALARIVVPINAVLAKEKKLKTNLLPTQVLRASISHPSASLRSSAIAFLCSLASSTSQISSRDLDLMRDYFRWNAGETDAEMKQNSCAALQSFLHSLRRSSQAAAKRLADARRRQSASTGIDTDDAQDAAHIRHAKDFVSWISNLCSNNIVPAAPYRNQAMGLRYLEIVLSTGVDPTYVMGGQPAGSSGLKWKCDVSSGLHQPRFPFTLSVADSSLCRSLIRCLLSTYNDVREVALALLQRLPSPLPGFEPGFTFATQIVPVILRLMHAHQESQNSAGALLLRLYLNKELPSSAQSIPKNLLPRGLCADSDRGVLYCFLEARLDDLEISLEQLEEDLGYGCKFFPVQGLLMAFSRVLDDLSQAQLTALHQAQALAPLLHRTRHLIHRLWDVCRNVLCAAAPEGQDIDNVPDHEEARALRIDPEVGGDQRNDADVGEGQPMGPRHRIVLTCCWRGMKEASILYARLVEIPASLGSQVVAMCWSVEELCEFGATFELWLLSVRHHGAFGAIAPAYGSLARSLCQLPVGTPASNLPARWLEAHVHALTSRIISFTRRSAGLPFCILAACQAVSDRGSVLIKTMETLIGVARDVEIDAVVRIHSTNTLTILHRDRQLPVSVMERFIEQSYALAIVNFEEVDWRVRNCSLILFSALTARVFGAQTLVSTRGRARSLRRMPIADFCVRYPSLLNVLLGVLERSIQSELHNHAHLDRQTPLYSVLLLLSLLQTSSDAFPELASSFVPLGEACLGSKVFKIRAVAADALTGLIPSENACAEVLRVLATPLPSSFNKVHGNLMLCQQLLYIPANLVEAETGYLATSLQTHAAKFLHRALPYSCRAAYFDVLETARLRFGIYCKIEGIIEHDVLTANLGRPTLFPARTQFEAAAGRYFGADAPNRKAKVAESQTDGSSELMRPLANLRLAPDTEDASEAAILVIARDADLSVVVRIPALRTLLLRWASPQRGRSFGWPLDNVLFQEKSAPLPIRVLLLPLAAQIARGSASDHTEGERLLRLIGEYSDERRISEERLAAAQAVRILAEGHCHVNTIAFIHAVMALLQDDDDDVRADACATVGELYNRGSAIVPTRGFEVCLERLEQLEVNTVDRFLEADLCIDFEDLENPSALLFASERPNLYRDDLLEMRLASSGSSELSQAALPRLQVLLSRLRSAGCDGSPLGPCSKRSWWRIAALALAASSRMSETAFRLTLVQCNSMRHNRFGVKPFGCRVTI